MTKEVKNKKYLFEYNLGFVNALSILILLVTLLITYSLQLTLDGGFFEEYGLLLFDVSEGNESMLSLMAVTFITVVVMIFWFVLHEIIHGVAYRLCGAKKENITYGVVLEKGILYCRCNEFVNKRTIMISVLAPFIIIGVVTYIIGIIFTLGFLVLLSIFNICGAAGDLAMFGFFLNRKSDIKFRELDDSTTFCLETSEDLVGKKFLAVKLKRVLNNKELNDIKDEKTKIVNITKFSWGFIIALLLLLLVSFGILLFI